MARFTETFADWGRGDWGDLGRFKAGRLDDGFFSATNMVVYDDMTIGPRAGLKDRGVTGLPNGEVVGMGFVPVEGKETWLIIGNKLYAGTTAMTAASGSLGSTPGTRIRHKESTRLIGGRMYFATDNSGTWRWGPNTHALDQVDADIDGIDIELYRDRLYVLGSGVRVYYSDAADPMTFQALAYFDVGYQFNHRHLFAHRNSLAFITDEYQWTLSGVPESTSTLRRTGETIPVADQPAIQNRDEIWYIPATRSAPVRWAGGLGDEKTWEHLEWSPGIPDTFAAAAQVDTDDLMFVDPGGSMLMRHNDVWTTHVFETDIAAICSRYSTGRYQITDGGDAGAAAKVYDLEPDLNRPAFVSDTYAQPGDDSTTPLDCNLYLPAKWHPQGKEMRVKEVVVEFTSWNTGTSETAHFDLVVEALDTNAVGSATSGGNTSQTYSFDEAVGSSSTSGTTRQIRFNTGDQGWGRSYQIRLDNIRSVSFRAISAVIDDEPRNTR